MKDEVMLGRKELDTNTLLVLRTFVNLFDAEEGRLLMLKSFEKVVFSDVDADCRCLRLPRLAQRGQVVNPSRLRSARFFSSLPAHKVSNCSYSVLFLSKSDSENAIALLDPLVKVSHANCHILIVGNSRYSSRFRGHFPIPCCTWNGIKYRYKRDQDCRKTSLRSQRSVTSCQEISREGKSY
jgi:hypothetical protein